MTNLDKAREIAKDFAIGDFSVANEAALEMAEWKDQQFKEYLEKKSRNAEAIWVVSHHEDYCGGYMDAIHEIINELFPATERNKEN